MQSLNLYFLAIPDETATASMDKWLSSIAKNKSAADGGLRLWLTHVPETATRPFLNARPFDIVSLPVRLSPSAREEYQVSLGGTPKKHMVCRTEFDDDASFEVLLSIAFELMKRSGQGFLAIDNALGTKLLGPGKLGDPFELADMASYPGAAFEVAHEDDEGALDVSWYVDASWLNAWRKNRGRKMGPNDAFSRFASLDYA